MFWPSSDRTLVLSFFGVVLIARPEFLFGQNSNSTVLVDGHEAPSAEKGTPTQRLIAVGCVHPTSVLTLPNLLHSVALLGVLGGTGARTSRCLVSYETLTGSSDINTSDRPPSTSSSLCLIFFCLVLYRISDRNACSTDSHRHASKLGLCRACVWDRCIRLLHSSFLDNGATAGDRRSWISGAICPDSVRRHRRTLDIPCRAIFLESYWNIHYSHMRRLRCSMF